MNYKNKKKLTAIDKQKIEARYLVKLEEYKLLPLDELQELYMKGGISSTDRQAIVVATNYLMKEKQIEMFKEKELTDVDSGKEEIKE